MNSLNTGVDGKNNVIWASDANQSYDMSVSPLEPSLETGINIPLSMSGNFILYAIVAVITCR